MKERMVWILWPAFLAAILGVGVTFSLFDPADMEWPGGGSPSPMAAYTLG